MLHRRFVSSSIPLLLAMVVSSQPPPSPRTPPPRARDLGIVLGTLPTGARNAITDVAGVRVGHCTLSAGDRVRTGVTVVLPHGDHSFLAKVPAAVFTMNGFGKLAGSTQVDELGELETPIALTNTLAVGAALEGLVAWTLAQPGCEDVRSVNAVVAETNDGRLNDIRGRHVRPEHVAQALADATDGVVAEGCVGAGTGTVCFGFKGGIGTASRRVQAYTVGVLVQTNFGGRLTVAGQDVHAALHAAADARAGTQPARQSDRDRGEHGSCVVIIATDAPVCARNLRRLAQRAFAGMARTGASFSNGSGDYAIAFSTAAALRIRPEADTVGAAVLANAAMSPLFVAVADATEEAILNSLLAAETTRASGQTVPALPIDELRALRKR